MNVWLLLSLVEFVVGLTIIYWLLNTGEKELSREFELKCADLQSQVDAIRSWEIEIQQDIDVLKKVGE